ncbi:arsenate reductase family protein [Flammeovirga aprica]|uniref:Arsenate reductase n=1 Tax=Flammeovirga aprica JL-4 TaxID=694437 RepID=A0A7X9P2W9_9BACT|nr:hypothetical protein [Flammeovirga aprica]NME68425.1 hypothetical protein [Flammeovirga aprica JL-4]
MSHLKLNHPIVIYDSNAPNQQFFINDLRRKNHLIREIEINVCPVSEGHLIHIMENINLKPTRALINTNSPWYRCFAEDLHEMSPFVLIRTLRDFPSLLKTPIVILENDIFIDPSLEDLSQSHEEEEQVLV